MYLMTPGVIGNTFPVNNDKSYSRGRDDVIWQHMLLKIAMTNSLSNLKVRTLTINSGDVPPTSNMFRHVPPHLSTKPCLDMTSFGNYLLFIAMTHVIVT